MRCVRALAVLVGSAVAYETQIPLRLIQTAPTNDRADWRQYTADLVALNPQFEYQMFDDERALAFARNRSDQKVSHFFSSSSLKKTLARRWTSTFPRPSFPPSTERWADQ